MNIIKNTIFYTLIITTLLANHHVLWSMEEIIFSINIADIKKPMPQSCSAIIPYPKFNLKEEIRKYEIAEYNNNSPLIALSPEIFERIISNIDTLDEALNTALSLRATCTYFNDLPLEYFSKALQHHNQIEKNQKLKFIAENIFWGGSKYSTKRSAGLILMLAGAKENNTCEISYSFLLCMIRNNDTQTISDLFKKNAINPNQKNCVGPAFFYANIEIAEIFRKNGANFHEKGNYRWAPNVLWWNIDYKYASSQEIEYYLNHFVSAKEKNNRGDCLLHLLASPCIYSILYHNDNDNLIKTAQLLLKKYPQLINIINEENNSPMQLAQTAVKTYDPYINGFDQQSKNIIKEYFKKLIAIFKQYGGRTTKQLKKDQKRIEHLNKIKEEYYKKYRRNLLLIE